MNSAIAFNGNSRRGPPAMRAARPIVRTALATLAIMMTSCGPENVEPTPAPRPAPPARIWIFPGVGTNGASLSAAIRGLRAGGVTSHITIQEWSSPAYDLFGHLTNIEANRAAAARTAGDIAEFARCHPGATLDLLGYSGGGGVAVLVAEALPDDVCVRRIVLVQAAISPAHDLRPALRHVSDRLVNLHCRSDWFILGLGTQTFGTIDRERVASAGKDGFDCEAAVPDPLLRTRLEQRPWSSRMLWSGHPGNHLGILMPNWNRDFVAPLLSRGPLPSAPQE